VFISSADWMPRNLNRRVETLVPVEDKDIHAQVQTIINVNLRGKGQSWLLLPSGEYRRMSNHPNSFRAHDYFMEHPRLGAPAPEAETKMKLKVKTKDKTEVKRAGGKS